jgi:thiosulfate reductase cytochrome b subunit
MTATQKFYFYPVWLRIWHGCNALGILLLIFTGISMQSSVESSHILGFNTIIKIHNIAGILVTLSYLLFFFGNIFTSNGKFYIIKPKGFIKNPIKQAVYYAWGMFHGMSTPFPVSEKRKFNPLQKYAYVLVMYMAVPIVIITGLALLFPEIIIDKVYNLSGVFITAVFHSSMGFFISIFLLVHLYIASIGKSPLENFKSIITGWHHTH